MLRKYIIGNIDYYISFKSRGPENCNKNHNNS